MADRPIIFSAPMVRALLDGRKTQTRRVPAKIKWAAAANQTFTGGPTQRVGPRHWQIKAGICLCANIATAYAPGDRLWVRETVTRQETDQGIGYQTYAADGANVYPLTEWYHRRNSIPSIHMPRWASRLTLKVTDVRVQRLQEITLEDAAAEGWGGYVRSAESDEAGNGPRTWFRKLWNSIHGPSAWDANLWVAAYTFTVHRCNIDQMEADHG